MVMAMMMKTMGRTRMAAIKGLPRPGAPRRQEALRQVDGPEQPGEVDPGFMEREPTQAGDAQELEGQEQREGVAMGWLNRGTKRPRVNRRFVGRLLGSWTSWTYSQGESCVLDDSSKLLHLLQLELRSSDRGFDEGLLPWSPHRPRTRTTFLAAKGLLGILEALLAPGSSGRLSMSSTRATSTKELQWVLPPLYGRPPLRFRILSSWTWHRG